MSEQEKLWRSEERFRAAKECCDVNGLDHCPHHLEVVERRVAERIAQAEFDRAEQARTLERAVIDAAMLYAGPHPRDCTQLLPLVEACAALRRHRGGG